MRSFFGDRPSSGLEGIREAGFLLAKGRTVVRSFGKDLLVRQEASSYGHLRIGGRRSSEARGEENRRPERKRKTLEDKTGSFPWKTINIEKTRGQCRATGRELKKKKGGRYLAGKI